MDKDNKLRELGREDYIWIIFICLSILSIVADSYQRNYIIYNSKFDGEVANKIYILILVVTILIYLYFFRRNYRAYINSDFMNSDIYEIKLFGSILFIVGGLCLLYFQVNSEGNFVGGPII